MSVFTEFGVLIVRVDCTVQKAIWVINCISTRSAVGSCLAATSPELLVDRWTISNAYEKEGRALAVNIVNYVWLQFLSSAGLITLLVPILSV